METIIQKKASMLSSNQTASASKTASANTAFWEKLEFNRFGAISMILVLTSCIGGLAAMVAVQHSTIQLAVLALCMTMVESFILAVMPMRTITIASAVLIVVSLFIILF